MNKNHYNTSLKWIGKEEKGNYSYSLSNSNHEVCVEERSHVILGSSDHLFLAGPRRCNAEELFFGPISNCLKFWYLHLCCVQKVNVIAYWNQANEIMAKGDSGSGRFIEVILRPQVKIGNSDMIGKAYELHIAAYQMLLIINSCNFKIEHTLNIMAI